MISKRFMASERMFYTPLLALLISITAYAEDVAPLRITNVEGALIFSYREDQQEIHLAGDSATREKRMSFEQALELKTEGYVYHPKFLSFELGLGPQMVQNELESTSGSYYQSEQLSNVNVLLDFLQDKPYPLKVRYNKEHPTISISLDDQFEQETVSHGANLQLKKPLIPINIVIDHSHQETTGEGFERRIDENLDQTILRTYIPSGLNGHQQIVLTSTQVSSNSGLKSAPLSPDEYETKNISYDANLYFGDKDNIRLNNLIAYTNQTGVRDYRELRVNPNLRILHSTETESYYKLNYVNNDQITLQSTSQNTAVGARHALNNEIDLNAELSSNIDETMGLSNVSNSANGSVNYAYKFNNGSFSLNSGIRLDNIDRNISSNVPVSTIVTLMGTTPYELPHDHILPLTITATLVATNDTLNVAEGTLCNASIDLLVKVIDTRTTITYCKGFDEIAEDIYISYDYDPGGSVNYNNQTSYLQANIDWLKQYSAFVHYRTSTPYVLSGDPLLPLDDSTNILLGLRGTFPLGNDRDFGAEYTTESHQSSLTPYERSLFDIYYQNPLWRGSLRFSIQKLNTDYLTSSEDIDSTRYSLQYRARPHHTTSLSMTLDDTTDLGGSVARNTQSANVTFSIRVRKFSFGSEFRASNEFLGANIQRRSLIHLFVKREF